MVAQKRRTQADRRKAAESGLVEAAVKLIAERGYDGFTLSDVGHAAGYSRGLPAHYFGRKEDLLALVAKHAIDLYLASITDDAPQEPGLPRIASYIRKYLASRDDTSRALNLIIAEAAVRPELNETVRLLNARGLAGLEAEVQAGIKSGSIRADVNSKAVARVIYALLRGQLSFTTLDPTIDTDLVAEEFIAMLQLKLSSGRGR